jgi:predicted CXXCH cytochrome family protein
VKYSRALTNVAVAGFCLAMSILSAGAQRMPAAGDPASVAVTLPPQTSEGGYTGEARCQSCHKAELTEFHKTTHAHVTRGTQAMNCETCHGPGQAHADAQEAAHGDDAASAAANRLIFAFHGTAQEDAGRCLVCHITARGQQSFAHSQHVAVGVSCQTCHATHLVAPAESAVPPSTQARFFAVPQLGAEQRWLRESLLKDSQPGLCFTCHGSVQAKFALPFHHRVPEGAMKCTDCHNAHGTANRASLNAPNWETCAACHVEKRGPFVFEHAAVRVEGCAICHDPHGGAARFMLARRESRFLCLQCHGDSHAAQASVPHGRLSFQTSGDCTRCHATIHGSNFDPNFLH